MNLMNTHESLREPLSRISSSYRSLQVSSTQVIGHYRFLALSVQHSLQTDLSSLPKRMSKLVKYEKSRNRLNFLETRVNFVQIN